MSQGRGRGSSQGVHHGEAAAASTPASGSDMRGPVAVPPSSQGPVRSSARLAQGKHARTTGAFDAVLHEAGDQGAGKDKASDVEAAASAPSLRAPHAEGAPALSLHSPAVLPSALARLLPTSAAGGGAAPLPTAPAPMVELPQEPARLPSPIAVPATQSATVAVELATAPTVSATLPSAASTGNCAPIAMVTPVVPAKLPQEPAVPAPPTSRGGDAIAPSFSGPVFVAEWTQEPARMSQSTSTGALTTSPFNAPAQQAALRLHPSPTSSAGAGTARPVTAPPLQAEWQLRPDEVVVAAPAGIETASPVVPPMSAESQSEAAATAATTTAGGGTARLPVTSPFLAEWQPRYAGVLVGTSAGLGTVLPPGAPSATTDRQLASTRAPVGAWAGGGTAPVSRVLPFVPAMTPLTAPSTSVTMTPINSVPVSAMKAPLSALPAPAGLPEPSASSSLLDFPGPVTASPLLPPWASAAALSVTPALPVPPERAVPPRAPTRPLAVPPSTRWLRVTPGGLTDSGTGTVEASRTTDGGTPETQDIAASPMTALLGSQGGSASRGTTGGFDTVFGELPRADIRSADAAPSAPEDNTDVTPDEPSDGVFKLDQTMQANIATLLRVLFAVQDTSDKSCMPFLGVAHYLMAFSYLVDISTIAARELFYDGLHTAFERPATMKVFMAKAFRTSEQGLHVGGRTRTTRHVIGQPDGLREEILRQKLNPGNAKVQWLSRRLRLRTSLDVQVGARSTAGGLTAEDRLAVLAGISQEEVCTKLAERGCTVKYARSAGNAAGPRPIALKFRWDATTTWFPGGMEATLVSGLQHDLLRGTPVAFADKETGTRKEPKMGPEGGVFKTAEPSKGEAESGARGRKRAKIGKVSSSTDVLGRCRTCGHDETDMVSGTVAPVPAQSEWWSADIAKWGKLSCGGHVLVVSLPVDMDRSAAGRPYVSADIQLNTKQGAPPYRYTVHVKRSPLPAEPAEPVSGASYTMLDGHTPLPHAQSHSWDILRMVRSFLGSRRGPPVATDRDLSGGTTEQGGDLALFVRSASRRAPLIERVDFVSQYELSTKAELIARSPGRMAILWAGVEPRPMGGASTL